ncbi:MAG: hypothetical protein H8D65_02205 [Spirochaetes bacterium]|nr:hypothetical protein [Spirochaetota bacterium]
MTHIILWFNLAAFTLLFAGFGSELVNWLRRRESWRVLYLWYIALYALWLLLQTFLFFNFYYLDQQIEGLGTIMRYLRGIISTGVIVVYPLFVIKAAAIKPGRKQLYLLFLPAAACIIVIIISFFRDTYILSVVLNLFFNLYMLGLSLIGIFKLRSISSASPNREIRSFLYLNSGLYIMLLIFGTAFTSGLFQAQRALISVGIGGVFCLIWAGFLLYTGFQRAVISGRELNGLPEYFITDFRVGLTVTNL